MAYQGQPKVTGENVANPTRAGRPVGETYKAPKLDRGSVVIQKVGPDGQPLADSNYGRNQNAVPSSVGVEQSADLTDFDISPKGGDPVRASLVKIGFGDRTGAEDNAVGDLQRKIDTTPYAPAHGMRSPNNPAEKVPNKISAAVQPGPVRRPS